MKESVNGLEDLSYTSNLSPAYELSSEDVDMENAANYILPPPLNQESHVESTKTSRSFDGSFGEISMQSKQFTDETLTSAVARESATLQDANSAPKLSLSSVNVPTALNPAIKQPAKNRKRRRSEDFRDLTDTPARSISGFAFDQNPYQHCSRFDPKFMRTVLKRRTALVLKKYFLVVSSETKNRVDSNREIVKNSPHLQEIMRTDYAQGKWRSLSFLKEFYASSDVEEVHELVSFLIMHFTNSGLKKWKEPEIAGIENYMKFQEANTKSLKRDKARYPCSDLDEVYIAITEGLYKHIEKPPRNQPTKKEKKPVYDGPAKHLRPRKSLNSTELESTQLDVLTPEAMVVDEENLEGDAYGLLVNPD